MPQQKTERLLIKLHGDLNHPDRLVVTEEDYDNFLNRNPLMSTYLGNLLITRTPVFIGYSLDDPDFRQIWQIIGSRLGDMRRRAYAITVGIKPSDTARYERRGIKIVNISPNKDKYAETLEKFFVELHDYWLSKLIKVSTITDEASLQELSLSEKDPTRICLFLIPVNLQSFYKDKVFPIVQEVGLVPMLPEMMISPGDNSIAKINALINRSHIVVADLSSSILTEIGINFPEKKKLPKLLVIQEENIVSPLKIRGIEVILRPSELYDYPEKFLNDFQKLLQKFAEELMPQLSEEPLRLLNKKEYRAAVVSSISLVENTLRECLSKDDKCSSDLSKRPMPIRQMIDLALAQELIDHKDKAILIRGVYLRNELVHSTKPSKESTREFTKIVNDVMGIIDKTKSQKN
jgi:hypothetical protein